MSPRPAFWPLALVVLLALALPLSVQAARPAPAPNLPATITALAGTARAATSTATAIPPSPTMSPSPSPSPLPTGPQSAGNGGGGWCFGPLGCLDWSGFLASLGNGVISFLIGGLNALVDAVTGVLTALVRVDAWSELHLFFAFVLAVGGGMAMGLCVLGALRYYRGLLPGGNPSDGAAGLGMLTRTLETALLLAAADWGLGQLFDAAQAIGDAITGYTGAKGAHLLTALVAVFTNGGLSAVALVLGVVAFVVYLLVILVKLGSVALLAWLYVVTGLVLPTWTLGSGVVARWLWSLLSVCLWGAAWGVWLKVSIIVLTSWTIDPLLQPFVVVALLLFGYGVPGAVDRLLNAGAAAMSGAYGLPSVLVGAATGAVSAGASLVGQAVGRRLIP